MTVLISKQLSDLMRTVWKHLGAWASQASTQGCLDPLVPLPPSKGSVEVSSRSSAEQMGPARRAEVLHRDRLKKDVSFCGSVTQRGEKIHPGARNWGFDAGVADSAALIPPGCWVLVTAGFALWRKTWLLFDPSAFHGGGALSRDAAGLSVPYLALTLSR